MKFYLGVTDNLWFNYLKQIEPEDVNFWQPGGNSVFRVLQAGEPFLFKLRKPGNLIAGVAFFVKHTFLPISIAWDTFEKRNGCNNYLDFLNSIKRLRTGANTVLDNPQIGCIVLTNPIFFEREDWIQPPEDWKPNIVQGKGYDTTSEIGNTLWKRVEVLIRKYDSKTIVDEPQSGYSISQTKIRIGQGAFRVLVTDAYSRRCAITGERTLPVLEAAHIHPFSDGGPNQINNGLLLRSDMHKLFDSHYITITPDYKIEVSRRIKEEYENGKEYYKYHGTDLVILPSNVIEKPYPLFLERHNELFRG